MRDAPEGRAVSVSALPCGLPRLASAGLLQAQGHATVKRVTLGSFLWRFMALGGLVSSDKLQRLPNTCPNPSNVTLRCFVRRLNSPGVWAE